MKAANGNTITCREVEELITRVLGQKIYERRFLEHPRDALARTSFRFTNGVLLRFDSINFKNRKKRRT